MDDVIKRLAAVTRLHFSCTTQAGSQTDWNRKGSGSVRVLPSAGGLDFEEIFVLDDGRRCTDRKRWRIADGRLCFDHWRHGGFIEVFALAGADGDYRSESDYLCPPDRYSGSLNIRGGETVLRIRIVGQRKNELLEYVYV